MRDRHPEKVFLSVTIPIHFSPSSLSRSISQKGRGRGTERGPFPIQEQVTMSESFSIFRISLISESERAGRAASGTERDLDTKSVIRRANNIRPYLPSLRECLLSIREGLKGGMGQVGLNIFQ
ncbi:hypothetical protein JTE90_020080 [Oedothorax gibbosus]|uniref:Uncharacterized protein n=1 Tax=Oedothorax gibbosus TaxID=931172 RepID=A0AAV6UUL9_9ARAC|nr:hypothetical protein JTE90_020080 [Oedothorax gibbosus]